MASRLSDELDHLSDAARRGDWRSAQQLVDALAAAPLPTEHGELGKYLARLLEVTIVAKVSRANAAATLLRLRAAASFNRSALESPGQRQNPGYSTAS